MVKAKNCRKNIANKTTNDAIEDPNMPVFFYFPDSKPYGMFCQWYPASFAVTLESFAYLKRDNDEIENWTKQIRLLLELPSSTPTDDIIIKFGCTEQYMMYCKALYFSNFQTAKSIMATNKPKEQKLLGRKVREFDRDVWMDIASKVVEEGNYAKFTHDNKLKVGLLRTGEQMLREAASKDSTWGIGKNAAMQTWKDGKMQGWGKR